MSSRKRQQKVARKNALGQGLPKKYPRTGFGERVCGATSERVAGERELEKPTWEREMGETTWEREMEASACQFGRVGRTSRLSSSGTGDRWTINLGKGAGGASLTGVIRDLHGPRDR